MATRPAETDELARVLATGQAIFLSIGYDGRAWDRSGPVIPDYRLIGSGHAVVLMGYRWVDGARQFLIHNSWSTDWRDHGYAWISDRMVRDGADQLATLEVAVTGEATPNGLPSTQRVACPAGSLLDLMTLACAAPCPSGLPRVSGACFP